MIRIAHKPEYPDFDAQVRQPGATFLANCPNPSSAQYRKKNYWSRAAPELHAAYSGICAYTAVYLPQQGSVDHFRPKSAFPQLAYEWSNFRLASGRVNSAKGSKAEVLDPFEIEDDWFHLDIPECLMRANAALPRETRVRINATINSLRLNDDDHYAQDRCNILMEYASGDVTLGFLHRRYPFLAKEVERQGLEPDDLRGLFRM
ncbi:HNH endonuclease family protein [Pontixanthobacter gangjinensis]|uniref:TIGR02646 family protein n=1 Tax=Pontixanthobacter gangjinensis TaxID=1028742 RepID=A0A6I4SKF4_9SPHN|nr:hypothetical protein [Pontixanthobacter gangjinensis]MXO55292.1 hypothetical protein [Pontixanthobacter gangjinensis]